MSPGPLSGRVPGALSPSRMLFRNVTIVWVGIVLSFIGWVASEYGSEVQRTAQGSIALIGDLVLLVGLITIVAGFAYVVRAIGSAWTEVPTITPPESRVGTQDRAR
jgi:Na+/pantothenate symporter